MNWRDVVSEMVTKVYKIAGYLKPGLVSEKKKYEKLLGKHREDGRYIEARMFVLTKD
jgi:hypothetical protein